MSVSHRKKLNTYLFLNIIWGILSLTLLCLVLFFTWQKERLNIQQSLYSLTDEIADQLDNFIQDTTHLLLTLDITSSPVTPCPPQLLKQIQQIVFNNPFISGVSIRSSDNKVHCSTLHQETISGNNTNHLLSLFGPTQINSHDKPAYILSQRLGQNSIAIYLLEQIFARNLQTSSLLAKKVSLYDKNTKKIILQISRTDTDSWRIDDPKDYLKQKEVHQEYSIMRVGITTLDNLEIMLQADLSKIKQITWKEELITAVIILLLCLSIYYLMRFLINRHFSFKRAILVAMRNDNFFPMYQPILDTKKEESIGAEILLRWRTSEQEVITPDLFIKDLEASGLIVHITLQLVEKAFIECQSLLINNPKFHLAFNLSSIHFTDNNFFKDFLSLCKKYHIAESQIMLEITERDLLKQDDLALVKTMKELRQAGFCLAVDDFGTGHASISYLQHFPFNYLKIDQIFIKAIGTGAITETLNKSIIQMAKNLKLNIIAEGVETFTQLEYLQSQGVHLMQGWYFATAMPLEKLIQFVKGVHNEE